MSHPRTRRRPPRSVEWSAHPKHPAWLPSAWWRSEAVTRGPRRPPRCGQGWWSSLFLLGVDDDAGQSGTVRADGGVGEGLALDGNVQWTVLGVGKVQHIADREVEDACRADGRRVEP